MLKQNKDFHIFSIKPIFGGLFYTSDIILQVAHGWNPVSLHIHPHSFNCQTDGRIETEEGGTQ